MAAYPCWLPPILPRAVSMLRMFPSSFISIHPQNTRHISIALGARHVDIGQGTQSWVVLADPEGNEFCLLVHTPTEIEQYLNALPSP